MAIGSVKHCMCVEAKEPGWCDLGTGVCASNCPTGHDFSAANPCKPYPNPCPTENPDGLVPSHHIRYLEPGSDLYYCMDKFANMCSINASKPGPNGPGSAWGSVHPPCFPPEDSSSCSSSWPVGAIVTTVILACLVVAVALLASRAKWEPLAKDCWEQCQKRTGWAQESTNGNISPPGVQVSNGLFSQL